jgi:hypothetical protein
MCRIMPSLSLYILQNDFFFAGFRGVPDRTPLPVLLSGLHHLPPCQVNQKGNPGGILKKTEALEEVCNEHHGG